MTPDLPPYEAYELADLVRRRAAGDRPYLEFLRRPALSTGLYVLPSGGVDGQRPHAEDEVYVVLAGRATLRIGAERTPVSEGSVVFVGRGVPHRFEDVEGELRVLVLFAPAETDG